MIKRTMILAAAGALAACAVTAPHDLAAMSSDDICYYEYIQGRNLSPETRQAIQGEMQRRNDSCRNHSTEVAHRYNDFMAVETYGRQSP